MGCFFCREELALNVSELVVCDDSRHRDVRVQVQAVVESLKTHTPLWQYVTVWKSWKFRSRELAGHNICTRNEDCTSKKRDLGELWLPHSTKWPGYYLPMTWSIQLIPCLLHRHLTFSGRYPMCTQVKANFSTWWQSNDIQLVQHHQEMMDSWITVFMWPTMEMSQQCSFVWDLEAPRIWTKMVKLKFLCQI